MKAIKTLLITLMFAGAAFVLTSCKKPEPVSGDPEGDDYTMEQAVAYVSALLPEYAEADLALPDAIEDTTATIEWSSADETVISSAGKVTRGYEFQEVRLSARIRLHGASETVRQNVTVIPWEKPMPTDKKITFGYYYEATATNLDNISASKVNVINYSFAYLKSGKIDVSGLRFINQIINLRQLGIKVVISVGGGGTSNGFSLAVSTANNRKILIDSIIECVKKYHFSGVDIDWEYPGSGPDANPNDKENFANFLRELKAALVAVDPNMILTAAVGIDPSIIKNIDVPNVKDSLDYIHLMTYDFVGADTVNNQHLTNLYTSKMQGSYSAHTAVINYSSMGMPLNKIVIGAAFYGKLRTFLPDGTPTSFKTITYTNIKKSYLSNPDYYHWDEVAMAPYLTDDFKTFFITYDDVNSVKAKCDYVKEKGLGGIMFWQYNLDDSGDLLNAIYQNIRG